MPETTADADQLEVSLATPVEIANSRGTWNALAAAMKYPSIFCTWEWIHTWLKHFGHTHELVILFICRREKLTGILPLFIENNRKALYVFPRKLGFCGSTRVFPDHLDIICAAEDATACMDAAFGYLNSDFTRWDILHLPFIAEDSNLFTWLESHSDRINWRETDRTFAPYIKITGSFEDYLGCLKSTQRYSLVRHKRKLLKNHDARYIECRKDDMSACLGTVFDLHARRAAAKQIISSFSGDEIFRFHMDLLKEIQDKDWAWIRLLECGENTIAAYYGFAFANRVFYYQTGQDPDWQGYAPGTVILHDAIEEAFDGNYAEFNFLQGEEDYKYKWTKTHRILYDIVVYHSNLPGRATRLRDTMKRAMKTALGRKE